MTDSMLRHRLPYYFRDMRTFTFLGHLWGFQYIMDDYGNAVSVYIDFWGAE